MRDACVASWPSADRHRTNFPAHLRGGIALPRRGFALIAAGVGCAVIAIGVRPAFGEPQFPKPQNAGAMASERVPCPELTADPSTGEPILPSPDCERVELPPASAPEAFNATGQQATTPAEANGVAADSEPHSGRAVLAAAQAPQTDRLNCEHFPTQQLAQLVLDDDRSDPHRLDDDNDGIACEQLPRSGAVGATGVTPPTTAQPRPTTVTTRPPTTSSPAIADSGSATGTMTVAGGTALFVGALLVTAVRPSREPRFPQLERR